MNSVTMKLVMLASLSSHTHTHTHTEGEKLRLKGGCSHVFRDNGVGARSTCETDTYSTVRAEDNDGC